MSLWIVFWLTRTLLSAVPQVAISPKDLGIQSRLERALRSLDLSDPYTSTAIIGE